MIIGLHDPGAEAVNQVRTVRDLDRGGMAVHQVVITRAGQRGDYRTFRQPNSNPEAGVPGSNRRIRAFEVPDAFGTPKPNMCGRWVKAVEQNRSWGLQRSVLERLCFD